MCPWVNQSGMNMDVSFSACFLFAFAPYFTSPQDRMFALEHKRALTFCKSTAKLVFNQLWKPTALAHTFSLEIGRINISGHNDKFTFLWHIPWFGCVQSYGLIIISKWPVWFSYSHNTRRDTQKHLHNKLKIWPIIRLCDIHKKNYNL